MDERDVEREERVVVEEEPVRRETTVISTGEGGGGGTVVAILLLLIVAVLAFLFFTGRLGEASEEVGVNVNVETPEVQLPDVDINVPPPSQPANKQ